MERTLAEKTSVLENKIPFDGKIWKPQNLKSDVAFVLVHQYGGSTKSLMRHIRLINQMGYTAVSFNLEGAHNQKMFLPPISRNRQWGLRHMWADRIEDVLKAVPGPKIVFSLSNPSFSTLEAVARLGTSDIKGLIFDGGPFFDVEKCYWNLFTHAYPTPLVRRVFQIFIGGLYWNTINYKKKTRKHLAALPSELPVLVFRAENDILVPVSSIDKLFARSPLKSITKVLLPNCGHLMGVKLHPELYKKALAEFLHL